VTLRQWLAFVFVATSWGTTFFFYKLAIRELPPPAILLYRTVLGTATLAVAALILRPSWRAPRWAWATMTVFGLFNLGFPQWLIVWSQQWVDSGMTAVMLASTPLLTLLAAQPVLPDEPITARRVFAIVLGFGGVVLLMSRGLRVGELDTLLGQLAQLGAAFCFAVTSVLVRWRGGGMGPIPQALWAAFVAALFAAALNAALGTAPALPSLPVTWLALLVVSVVTNGVTWLLFLRLLGTVGPTQTQMISYVVPLVAVALGVLVLGEPPRPELAGGGLLVLLALALSHSEHRRILAERGA